MARPVESVESTGPASDSLEPPSESHACSEATSCPISRAAFAITRTDEALGPTSVSTPSNPAIAAFASAFGFASGFGFGLASGFGFGVASGLGGRPCLWFHLLRILLSYRYLWRPCRHPWCPFPRPFLFLWPSPPWGFLDTLKGRVTNLVPLKGSVPCKRRAALNLTLLCETSCLWLLVSVNTFSPGSLSTQS